MESLATNPFMDFGEVSPGDPENPIPDPRPEVPAPTIPEETPPLEKDPEEDPGETPNELPPVEPVVPELDPDIAEPGENPEIPAYK